MKNNRYRERREYNNGYIPKIEYWTTQLAAAVESNQLKESIRCQKKVDYFTQRQRETELRASLNPHLSNRS